MMWNKGTKHTRRWRFFSFLFHREDTILLKLLGVGFTRYVTLLSGDKAGAHKSVDICL